MQRWNDFIDSHPQAHLFSALVSDRLPSGLLLDREGKKLPTPYKLLNKWLKKNTTGPYSMTWASICIVLGVAEAKDRQTILDRFGPCRSGGPTVGSRKAPILRNYMDGHYAQLAHEMGYALDFRSSSDA